MTEASLTQLKCNVKELVKFLKEHDLTSASIQLNSLGDLTVCNVKYSNDSENQESFAYFFENTEFEVNINEEYQLDNNQLGNNHLNTNTISTSDADIVHSQDEDNIEEASTDTQMSDTDTTKENKQQLDPQQSSDVQNVISTIESTPLTSQEDTNSSSSDNTIEPYTQESLFNEEILTSSTGSNIEQVAATKPNLTSIINDNDTHDTHDTHDTQHHSSVKYKQTNNTKLINFKEENDFQKQIIMQILKNSNVLT